jgi:hypothetical protein
MFIDYLSRSFINLSYTFNSIRFVFYSDVIGFYGNFFSDFGDDIGFYFLGESNYFFLLIFICIFVIICYIVSYNTILFMFPIIVCM